MSKDINLITITEDLIKEEQEIIDEFLEEEVQPLLDEIARRKKKAFDKEYAELKQLEKEV